MWPAKILFQITGSIAAYKSAEVISRLVKEGCEVQTVASPSALHFIGRATLEGLTGRKVLSDLFEPGQAMDHIHWARWADLAILCPASAHSINRLCAGLGDDLIASLFLAFGREKPYLLAPAMNSQMFAHPRVQASLRELKSWGVQVLNTESGRLACGEVGPGKLLDPEHIFADIQQRLQRPTTGESLLITAGATREPVDGVRFLTNISTGRTGALMADHFLAAGYKVVYLHGQGAERPQHPLAELKEFSSFADLQSQLESVLKSNSFKAVIHLAAVSDYSVSQVRSGQQVAAPSMGLKLRSDQELSLSLTRNPKIVDRLKEYSLNKDIKVVAFKLTHDKDPQAQVAAVERLLHSPHIDLVVHNDLSEVQTETDGQLHGFKVFRKQGAAQVCNGKEQMIRVLHSELFQNSDRLNSNPYLYSDHLTHSKEGVEL